MIKENTPPNLKKDGTRLFVWKIAKSILGTNAGQWILIRTCELAEKIAPGPFPLWKFYRLAIAGAIYKGFKQGLALFPQKKLLK
ncbi:MAG: hypothetical protein IPK90_10195 [Chitinophagaceae bacterium]|nr:hypothetical protein [Chitinophagaceae bacterium]